MFPPTFLSRLASTIQTHISVRICICTLLSFRIFTQMDTEDFTIQDKLLYSITALIGAVDSFKSLDVREFHILSDGLYGLQYRYIMGFYRGVEYTVRPVFHALSHALRCSPSGTGVPSRCLEPKQHFSDGTQPGPNIKKAFTAVPCVQHFS